MASRPIYVGAWYVTDHEEANPHRVLAVTEQHVIIADRDGVEHSVRREWFEFAAVERRRFSKQYMLGIRGTDGLLVPQVFEHAVPFGANPKPGEWAVDLSRLTDDLFVYGARV